MTGNRPELPGSHRGFEMVNPVVAQWETGNNSDCQDLRIANPLVAGSSRSPHIRGALPQWMLDI